MTWGTWAVHVHDWATERRAESIDERGETVQEEGDRKRNKARGWDEEDKMEEGVGEEAVE